MKHLVHPVSFGMRKKRFPKYVVYVVLSFAAPVVALLVTFTYQSITNYSFYQSLTRDESFAGAMMGFAEVVQLMLFTLIGCLVGIIFAVISLRVQRRVIGLGLAGLFFNGLPLLLLMFHLIKGWTVGL